MFTLPNSFSCATRAASESHSVHALGLSYATATTRVKLNISAIFSSQIWCFIFISCLSIKEENNIDLWNLVKLIVDNIVKLFKSL